MLRTAILCAAIGAATPAAAGFTCLPYDKLSRLLDERQDQAVHRRGVVRRGAIVELWREADNATWTFVLRFPDGRACIVAAGRAWMAATVPAEGAPA